MLEKLGYGHVISGPAVIMNGNSTASLLTFIRNKGPISISLYSLFFFLGFGSDSSHAYSWLQNKVSNDRLGLFQLVILTLSLSCQEPCCLNLC
jgi:hypothetical protein